MIWSVLSFIWSMGSLISFLCSIAPASRGDYSQAGYFVTLSIALSMGARSWKS